MPVSAPLFYLGYKEVIPREEGTRCRTAEELAAAEVLLDLLAGKASPAVRPADGRGADKRPVRRRLF